MKRPRFKWLGDERKLITCPFSFSGFEILARAGSQCPVSGRAMPVPRSHAVSAMLCERCRKARVEKNS